MLTNYYAEPIPKRAEFSCYEMAENLIASLRESNGLEFMPEEQRMALIAELSKPVVYLE